MLLEAISSIKLQIFVHPHEIVIVDDCSPDEETKHILHELKNEADISIIELTQNLGAQNARNIGISFASYNYIFMMDADDLLNTNKEITEKGTYVDRAAEILMSSPNVAFVHSATIMFGKKNEPRNNYSLNESLVIQKHRISIGLVYRKEDVITIEPYNRSVVKWQDWSFAVGLLNNRILHGKLNDVAYLKDPYYLYRIHDGSERISTKEICEKEMMDRTLNLYPEIFKVHFPHVPNNEIIDYLLINSQNIREFIPHICFNCSDTSGYCIRKLDFLSL